MHIFFPALIKTGWMAPIGAVNIANGCGIIHHQPGLGRERKKERDRVKFDYSPHTIDGGA